MVEFVTSPWQGCDRVFHLAQDSMHTSIFFLASQLGCLALLDIDRSRNGTALVKQFGIAGFVEDNQPAPPACSAC